MIQRRVIQVNQMEMHFDARIENEAFARTVAASFIASLNPTMDELIEVKTIISEGVANAIIHGYQSQPDGQVYLRLKTDKQWLHIEIEDFGVGITDIDTARQPLYTTRKDLERSGMGMTIMESLSDQIKIESEPNKGTKLTITKKLKHGSND